MWELCSQPWGNGSVRECDGDRQPARELRLKLFVPFILSGNHAFHVQFISISSNEHEISQRKKKSVAIETIVRSHACVFASITIKSKVSSKHHWIFNEQLKCDSKTYARTSSSIKFLAEKLVDKKSTHRNRWT